MLFSAGNIGKVCGRWGKDIYFLFSVLLTSVFIALIVLCGNDWSIIHIFLQESNDK